MIQNVLIFLFYLKKIICVFLCMREKEGGSLCHCVQVPVGWKRLSDSLELELQAVLSCKVNSASLKSSVSQATVFLFFIFLLELERKSSPSHTTAIYCTTELFPCPQLFVVIVIIFYMYFLILQVLFLRFIYL